MPGRNLFLFFVFCATLTFCWVDELYNKIQHDLAEQGQTVTFSVKFLNPADAKITNIENIEYPGKFYPGYNKLFIRFKDKDSLQKKVEFNLNIFEKVPVVKSELSPGARIKTENLNMDWVSRQKINQFTIKDKNEAVGYMLKFFKKPGDVLYRSDIKPEDVIKNNDPCTIVLKYQEISITMPGVALKNGSVGSKIKVLNTSTQKVIDAFVLNSRNVEVRLE
ncbi:MAG: flagellar basal body P-ring formation chaperone FlgA [Candidatus Margulisbacteria bacterium]|nr:flagellar basal body P-ring formation chaperone FlgA [Candidatus Margulisiibacteriota bacterium]